MLLPHMGSAQVGKPEWTNVPFRKKDKPENLYGPKCANGNSFALADMHLIKPDLIAYVIPDQGKARAIPLTPPWGEGKGSGRFSNFNVVGGRPCIVYTTWEKKTGVVTVMVQPYTTEWAVDGAPVTIGTIPLDPKSYQGWSIHVTVQASPDQEKVLFLFDDLQSGGVKLALCWVLDNELNPLWKGGYRIPVQATGSRRSVRILDNGHVYLRMQAVVLNEDNTKEKKDGSLQVKTSTANDKPESTWYELHGETFNMWDTQVASLNGSLLGMPILLGDRLFLGGYLKNSDKKDRNLRWAVVELGDGLTPTLVANGQAGEHKGATADSDLLTDKSGNPYLLLNTEGMTHVVGFGPDMAVKWSKGAPWSTALALPREAGLYMPVMGRSGMWKDVNAGKPSTGEAYFTNVFGPMMLLWGPDGSHSYHRLLPDDEGYERNAGFYFDFATMGTCGCYVDRSHEKEHPGMVRVKLD